MLAGEVIEIFVEPDCPVATGGNLFALKIEELVRWHIVGQDIATVSLQHGGEHNAVEHNVVLADEVNQASAVVLPPSFPVAIFGVSVAQFLSVADVADRSVEPHIKHLALCTFHRHRNTPVQVACHGTWAQVGIKPRFALAIHIGAPFFMLFQNPFFEPRLILVERQIPVSGFALHQRIAIDGVHWVNQFVGRKCRTAFLALVAIGVGSVAHRTFTLNITVGEELLRSLIVELFAFLLNKLAVVVQILEEITGKLVVDF